MQFVSCLILNLFVFSALFLQYKMGVDLFNYKGNILGHVCVLYVWTKTDNVHNANWLRCILSNNWLCRTCSLVSGSLSNQYWCTVSTFQDVSLIYSCITFCFKSMSKQLKRIAPRCFEILFIILHHVGYMSSVRISYILSCTFVFIHLHSVFALFCTLHSHSRQLEASYSVKVILVFWESSTNFQVLLFYVVTSNVFSNLKLSMLVPKFRLETYTC